MLQAQSHSLQQTIRAKFGRCYTIVPLWRVGSTYPAPASCGQRPDDHRGQMESPASFLDSGESLGSESPEGWRRAPELLCKPNARGQSIAEGNKLDGTPIGKRTLTRPVHGWKRPESHKALGRLGYHGAPHTPGTRLMSQNLKTALE